MRRLVRKLAGRVGDLFYSNQQRQEIAELRALIERERMSAKLAELHAIVTEDRAHPRMNVADRVSQLILLNQYRTLVRGRHPLPTFDDVEFRAFSQNGEDGILLFVFALIGMVNRRCVEICAGDGIQCNSANLIINHGWNGLLFDGDDQLLARGRAYYSRLGDTFCYPPKLVHSWITRDNVNDLIESHGFEGPVDLLSLDLDGMDYWIWEAIDVIRPRVVIAEIQCIWGAERAVTVPYTEQFKTRLDGHFGIYSGASLPAFTKLARKKGYRLVGVQRLGFNAVFIQDGIGEDILPEVDIDSCTSRPFVDWAKRDLLPKVADLQWTEV
jgi:hypothetical protein